MATLQNCVNANSGFTLLNTWNFGGGFSVNNSVAVSETSSVSWTLDSLTLNIGQTLATAVNIGNTTAPFSLNSLTSSIFSLENMNIVSGAGYNVNITGGSIVLIGANGSSFTDTTSLTIDTLNLLIGTSTATNLGIGNGTTGIYIAGILLQASIVGSINLSGTTGSSYSDVLSITEDAPTIAIAPTINTYYTLGNGTSGTIGAVVSDTLTITGNTQLTIDGASGATISIATGTASQLNLGWASCTIQIIAGKYDLQPSIEYTADAPLMNFGTSLVTTTINIGNASVTQISIDSGANVLIGVNTCTNLAFGNAATVTSLVGTQFQIATTVAFVADSNDLNLGTSVCTILNMGNANVSMSISALDMTILGTSTVQVDCSSVLSLGNADATTIQLSNPTATMTVDGTHLNIINLPTDTGTLAAPTHTPPAGYNYLCINTSTGVIAQFSA